MEFLILGPLEAWFRGQSIPLGGAKQRAVLAALLLRAGEVVTVERLIDEVWGDDPPPSAARSLESYVSRLRQLFNGHGPALVRRGAGYALELGASTLDAQTFAELLDEAGAATDQWEFERASERARAALRTWRGPALADVVLASTGRAEAERLEELKLRASELRFGADLELGRHPAVVGELQAALAQSPYREKFVEQLMVALYRSGRHAEALDAYEQLRRRLDSDLGLQPSAELQQLSGQIVRQELELRRPASVRRGHVARLGQPVRASRLAGLAAAGAVIAAAMAFTASGGAAVPERATPSAKKLALVLPGSADSPGVAADRMATAAMSAEILHELETQTRFVDPTASESSVEAVSARIRNEGIGLVVALGDGPPSQALAGVVRRFPETRFVFIDASLDELSLEGVSNATAIRFGDEDIYDLGGYVSGLVPTRDGSRRHVDMVSVVADEPTRDTARRISGFRRGLHAARPGVKMRVDYSHELEDPTACEQLANRQIDEGSDVVFAIAGRCGLGAVAVAKVRGVWSVGAEEDGIPARDDVLLRLEKEWVDVTIGVVNGLVKGTLPMGRDIVLGLEDGYATSFWFSYLTPDKAASAVVERCSRISASRHQDDF